MADPNQQQQQPAPTSAAPPTTVGQPQQQPAPTSAPSTTSVSQKQKPAPTSAPSTTSVSQKQKPASTSAPSTTSVSQKQRQQSKQQQQQKQRKQQQQSKKSHPPPLALPPSRIKPTDRTSLQRIEGSKTGGGGGGGSNRDLAAFREENRELAYKIYRLPRDENFCENFFKIWNELKDEKHRQEVLDNDCLSDFIRDRALLNNVEKKIYFELINRLMAMNDALRLRIRNVRILRGKELEDFPGDTYEQYPGLSETASQVISKAQRKAQAAAPVKKSERQQVMEQLNAPLEPLKEKKERNKISNKNFEKIEKQINLDELRKARYDHLKRLLSKKYRINSFLYLTMSQIRDLAYLHVLLSDGSKQVETEFEEILKNFFFREVVFAFGEQLRIAERSREIEDRYRRKMMTGGGGGGGGGGSSTSSTSKTSADPGGRGRSRSSKLSKSNLEQIPEEPEQELMVRTIKMPKARQQQLSQSIDIFFANQLSISQPEIQAEKKEKDPILRQIVLMLLSIPEGGESQWMVQNNDHLLPLLRQYQRVIQTYAKLLDEFRSLIIFFTEAYKIDNQNNNNRHYIIPNELEKKLLTKIAEYIHYFDITCDQFDKHQYQQLTQSLMENYHALYAEMWQPEQDIHRLISKIFKQPLHAATTSGEAVQNLLLLKALFLSVTPPDLLEQSAPEPPETVPVSVPTSVPVSVPVSVPTSVPVSVPNLAMLEEQRRLQEMEKRHQEQEELLEQQQRILEKILLETETAFPLEQQQCDQQEQFEREQQCQQMDHEYMVQRIQHLREARPLTPPSSPPLSTALPQYEYNIPTTVGGSVPVSMPLPPTPPLTPPPPPPPTQQQQPMSYQTQPFNDNVYFGYDENYRFENHPHNHHPRAMFQELNNFNRQYRPQVSQPQSDKGGVDDHLCCSRTRQRRTRQEPNIPMFVYTPPPMMGMPPPPPPPMMGSPFYGGGGGGGYYLPPTPPYYLQTPPYFPPSFFVQNAQRRRHHRRGHYHCRSHHRPGGNTSNGN